MVFNHIYIYYEMRACREAHPHIYLHVKRCPSGYPIIWARRTSIIIIAIRTHFGASLLSIRVLLSVQGVGHRLVDDEQVQTEAPVLDIPDIALDAASICSISFVSPRNPVTWLQPVMPGRTKWRTIYLSISCEYSSVCFSMCGRGPTMLMSPSSTLMNCGSSSMFVLRGSSFVACSVSACAFTFMLRNFRQ